MLDIRKPIGYLFLIIGALLSVYGLVQPQITKLAIVGDSPHELLINLNLPCGVSMFLFASIMLSLAYVDEARKKESLPAKDRQ